MATGAAFGLHWHMFVDERTLFIDMALVAYGVATGQAPQLPHGSRPVRIVAVHTLHQTLIDAVVIGFGKVRLSGDVAAVTQLGLLSDEQELFFLSVMGRVTIETSNVTAGVRRLGEMRLFVRFAVTG
jgi:hypothetical protein